MQAVLERVDRGFRYIIARPHWQATLLLGCLAGVAVHGPAQDRVSVEELEQRVAAAGGHRDKDVARRLENVELTERLSVARLEKLRAGLPGPESLGALLVVSDLAEVLDLPGDEMPTDPPASEADQKQMLARAYEAWDAARPMPDFDATVNITRFRNLKNRGTAYPIPVVVPVPVVLSHGADALACRQGRVITSKVKEGWAPAESLQTGMEGWDGVYGLLGEVMRNLRVAQPEWARWEQGHAGRVAVIRFAVNEHQAHFPLRTIMDPWGRRGYTGNPGYAGEVTVDPATGAVLRLVMRAKLDRGQRVSRADVVVEFGSLVVDGKPFVGPLRAVSLGVSQSLLGGIGSQDADLEVHLSQEVRPLLHVVDVEFTEYRKAQTNAPVKGAEAFVASATQASVERLGVEQLEKMVAAEGGDDRGVAQTLGQLELTERLTAERYARMRDRLPGKASMDALLALYDMAEFEQLPLSDVAEGAAPDSAAQGKMVTSAVEFVAGVMHKMPDLFATRELSRFEDLRVVRGNAPPVLAQAKPPAKVDQSRAMVHFREGREVVETAAKGERAKFPGMGLDTWGTFGPMLEIVMADVLKAKIGWSHWERGPSGRLAVFRYDVPEDVSHYEVRFCCYLAENGLMSDFNAKPGYHGELAIDPDTGAVVRLVLRDLRLDPLFHVEEKTSPLLRSEVLVEYGPVEIAGKQYVCPTRMISVMTSWTLGGQGLLKQHVSNSEGAREAKKALALMEFSRVNAINEALFRDYHVFRAEMRIVPN